MSGNWSDAEIRELLSLRAKDEILRQFNGTARDAVVYDNMTTILQKRGVQRRKAQIISKLKNLRKNYLSIKDRHRKSGNERLHWQYFELCEAIWGSSHPTNSVALLSNLEPKLEDNRDSSDVDYKDGAISGSSNVDCKDATILGSSNVDYTDSAITGPSNVDYRDGAISGSESTSNMVPEEQEESRPEFPCGPLLRKLPKRKSRHQQTYEELRRLLADMDRDFNEREAVRIQEQREYEDRVRREAREYERQQWSMQMAMWKEMQEAQNNFFKDVLSRLPVFSPPSQSPQQQAARSEVASLMQLPLRTLQPHIRSTAVQTTVSCRDVDVGPSTADPQPFPISTPIRTPCLDLEEDEEEMFLVQV